MSILLLFLIIILPQNVCHSLWNQVPIFYNVKYGVLYVLKESKNSGCLNFFRAFVSYFV